MKLSWKIWLILVIFVFGVFFVLSATTNADTASTTKSEVIFDVSEPVYPKLSLPVRDLPTVTQPPLLNRQIDQLWLGEGLGESSNLLSLDPLVPFSQNSIASPDPYLTFEGLGTDGFTPPDTVGDVGPNHYIQMVNVSFQIWDKGDPANGIPPSIVQPDTLFNALFAGFGGVCQNSNSGDPVVMYDDMADRWFMSQMGLTGGTALCIAVSTSPDPTGTYNLYAFPMPAFPDYPKYGIWPDAYFATTNTGFPNQYWAHAFDRAAMLAGLPATRQSFGGHPNLMLPADVDGPLAPPAGDPGIFYTFFHPNATGHPPGPERLAFYEFDVDWSTPANSTYTLVSELPIASFNYALCGFFVQCVRQPGTSQLLDDIAWWPMHRMQYRNFGNYAAMVGNFTVDADGADNGGIRWFEVRKTGSTYALHQEGTHFPDTDTRWMGSIAMDGSGNIALGYSVSSNTTIPSIRYATRRIGDPLGTLNTEASMWVGTGVQTSINRWGDYSAIAVDPVDNCTFWYTTEYHDINDGGFNWNTRVGVFRVPECTGSLGPDFTMNLNPSALAICAPNTAVSDVNFSWQAGYDSPVALSAIGVPTGYSANFSVNPIITPTVTSQLSLSNVGTVTPGAYAVEIVGIGTPTPTHTATLQLTLFNALPGAPTLLSPTNGAMNVSATPTFTWSDAGSSSYLLEVATDIGFSNIVYSANVSGTSHTAGAALNTSTTYFWRVRGSNTCGDGSYSAVFIFTTEAAPGDCGPGTAPNVIYEYGFESGDGGWTTSGTGNTWALSTANPHSGQSHFHGNGVATISDQRLASPAVVLPTGENPVTLEFWHAPYLEVNPPGCYDGGILEISNNGGSTWTQVPNANLLVGPYTGVVSSGFSNPLAGLQAWCGTNATYFNTIADVSAYAGQTVQFRMRLGTDSSVSRPGWDVDDVTVQSCMPSATPAIVLTKTVGVEPTVYPTTDVITVTSGTEVTYFYVVENTGDVTLSLHTLQDDQLGIVIGPDYPYSLAPGETVMITSSVTVTDTVTNVANWVATDGGANTAVAGDSATVHVVNPAVSLSKTVGTEPGVCATTDTITVESGTEVYYCYTVTNEGDVTLSLHDLADDQLGAILTGFAYDLAPGASVDTVAAGLTLTATIMTTTTNTAVWTAYNDAAITASATASATVNVPEGGYWIYLPVIIKP